MEQQIQELQERKTAYLSSKRGEHEPFEAYKIRMKEVNRIIKRYLKGRVAWDSRLPIPIIAKNEDGTEKMDDKGKPIFTAEYKAGSYVKTLHGEI